MLKHISKTLRLMDHPLDILTPTSIIRGMDNLEHIRCTKN